MAGPVLVFGVMDILRMKMEGDADEPSMMMGDLAEILEGKYKVMRNYYRVRQPFILAQVLDGFRRQAAAVLRGNEPLARRQDRALTRIEDDFKQFVAQRGFDSMGIPGVPTRAAMLGHSHRFKHPYKRRPPRPSFIDTGQFVAAFKAWWQE